MQIKDLHQHFQGKLFYYISISMFDFDGIPCVNKDNNTMINLR